MARMHVTRANRDATKVWLDAESERHRMETLNDLRCQIERERRHSLMECADLLANNGYVDAARFLRKKAIT